MEKQKFSGTIKMLLEKPGLFGINKIEDIYYFILGYDMCITSNDLEENDYSYFKDNFRDFVNKDFDSDQNHDWAKLIRLYSGSDTHSIQLFTSLFNKFIELQ
jgi:hypothetical protein